MQGTVKWYNRKKGYGFIESEDKQEYFVHYSALEKGTFIRDNDIVSFEPAEGEKGKQAQNVKLVKKASEIAQETTEIEEKKTETEAKEFVKESKQETEKQAEEQIKKELEESKDQ